MLREKERKKSEMENRGTDIVKMHKVDTYSCTLPENTNRRTSWKWTSILVSSIETIDVK